jgi:TadE-like protein
MRKLAAAAMWSHCRGTTAVEFGIILPALITLLVGALYLCMGLFVAGSLQFAVEDAARCASVNTGTCKDAGTITSFASSRYFGPGSAPTFTYAAAACGNSVTGSTNFAANLGIKTITVPISAAACFP